MVAEVIESTEKLEQVVGLIREQAKSIGIVPTMGALHNGHVSLAEASKAKADVTIATIFVNPTQFAAGEDLEKYPRTISADVEKLGTVGVDYVFVPNDQMMYPEGFSTYVDPPSVSRVLEGEHRPTHFRGVATIVLKLLNLTRADFAFFGQKDYQQVAVVRAMVNDLNVPCQIVTCPIVRDDDGMALSSRNRYLSDQEREQGLSLSRTIKMAEELIREGEKDTHVIMNEMKQSLIDGGVDSIDYAMVANAGDLTIPDTIKLPVVCLVAAHVGATRLIDNCLVE